MLRTMKLSVAFAAVLVATGGQVQAVPIVWVLDDGPNTILRVNPNTGAIISSFAAPSAFGTVAGLTIAEAGSSLLFTDQGAGNPLFRLNPNTGAVLSTHALPINNRGGLSSEGSTILSINNGLPIISQAGFGGALTPIGGGGLSFPGGLGGDDTGRHFAAAAGNIREIDLTGTVLNTLANPTGGSISGLAFDGTSLYVVSLGSRTLFTLNPNTGAILNTATIAGSGDLVGLGAFDSVVPEPSSLALLSIGAIGLFGYGYRRKRKQAA